MNCQSFYSRLVVECALSKIFFDLAVQILSSSTFPIEKTKSNGFVWSGYWNVNWNFNWKQIFAHQQVTVSWVTIWKSIETHLNVSMALIELKCNSNSPYAFSSSLQLILQSQSKCKGFVTNISFIDIERKQIITITKLSLLESLWKRDWGEPRK